MDGSALRPPRKDRTGGPASLGFRRLAHFHRHSLHREAFLLPCGRTPCRSGMAHLPAGDGAWSPRCRRHAHDPRRDPHDGIHRQTPPPDRGASPLRSLVLDPDGFACLWISRKRPRGMGRPRRLALLDAIPALAQAPPLAPPPDAARPSPRHRRRGAVGCSGSDSNQGGFLGGRNRHPRRRTRRFGFQRTLQSASTFLPDFGCPLTASLGSFRPGSLVLRAELPRRSDPWILPRLVHRAVSHFRLLRHAAPPLHPPWFPRIFSPSVP